MNLTLVLFQIFWFSGPAPEATICNLERLSGPIALHHTEFHKTSQHTSKELLQQQLREYGDNITDPNANMSIGVSFMSLADTTNWDFLDRALTHFDKAAKTNGQDPLLLMFRGRAIGAKALNTDVSTLKRLGWAREGFKLMDKAAAKDPGCFLLRLMRGEAQLMAHPILRRGVRLDEDASWLERFSHGQSYEGLPDFQKSRIELFLGNYSEKRKKDIGTVQDHWKRAISLAGISPWADEARARLNGTYRNLGYDGEES